MSDITTYKLSCACCSGGVPCPCPMMPTKLTFTLLSLTDCFPSSSGCATPTNLPSFIGVPLTATYFTSDPGTIGGAGFTGPGWYAQIPTYINAQFCPGGAPLADDLVMLMACSIGQADVLDAEDNGSGLIRITIADTSVLGSGGAGVTISGVGGTIEANGAWKIIIIDAIHFDLIGSHFANPFTPFSGAVAFPVLDLTLTTLSGTDGSGSSPQTFLTCVTFEADFRFLVTGACNRTGVPDPTCTWKVTV